MKEKQHIDIPSAEAYMQALQSIENDISENQKTMLKAHYNAHNRSITYGDLAASVGYDSYQPANAQYGNLGYKIGAALGFDNWRHDDGTEFHSSAIGMGNQYTAGEFQLVMHHELAKAIADLGWGWSVTT